MLGTVLCLALARLPGGLLLAAPPPSLVSYIVSESVHAVTPRGERDQALRGTVQVAGERAAWRVSAGTFPRANASVALTEGTGFTLLDPAEKLAARARSEEFEALFEAVPQPAAGGATLRDVKTSVMPDGAGRPFQGLATARYRVELSYTVSLVLPGRVTKVTSRTEGVIDALDAPDARSAFDGLLRLFPARGEARAAIRKELEKVTGLPVAVRLESVAETSAEVLGASGAPSPEGPARPLRTTSRTVRTVSDLSRRPFAKEDAALFTVPEDFRDRGLERLVHEVRGLP